MNNQDEFENENQSTDDSQPQSYEVGYGKPPKAKQYQKGRSGNRRGRPKGSKNFHTLLNEVLSQTMVVTENGKTVKLSKKTAIILQTVNKAVKGDMKATSVLLPHILNSDLKEEDQQKVMASMSTDDEAIIKMYLQKIIMEGNENDK